MKMMKLWAVASALIAGLFRTFTGRQESMTALANTVVHPEGLFNKTAEAAIGSRNLLVKVGSGAGEVDICGAEELPTAVAIDEAAIDTLVSCQSLWNTDGPLELVASEAIADGEAVYTAAGGKVQDLPVAAGTYYRIGIARSAAAADGDAVVVDTHVPIAETVS